MCVGFSLQALVEGSAGRRGPALVASSVQQRALCASTNPPTIIVTHESHQNAVRQAIGRMLGRCWTGLKAHHHHCM